MSKRIKESIKCDKCGERFIAGNKNGVPNGLGFRMKDGKLINICRKCIEHLGKLNHEGKEEEIKKFWRDLGIEVKE